MAGNRITVPKMMLLGLSLLIVGFGLAAFFTPWYFVETAKHGVPKSDASVTIWYYRWRGKDVNMPTTTTGFTVLQYSFVNDDNLQNLSAITLALCIVASVFATLAIMINFSMSFQKNRNAFTEQGQLAMTQGGLITQLLCFIFVAAALGYYAMTINKALCDDYKFQVKELGQETECVDQYQEGKFTGKQDYAITGTGYDTNTAKKTVKWGYDIGYQFAAGVEVILILMMIFTLAMRRSIKKSHDPLANDYALPNQNVGN